jgi:hypothetical protein
MIRYRSPPTPSSLLTNILRTFYSILTPFIIQSIEGGRDEASPARNERT